jgi:hypothetical protein
MNYFRAEHTLPQSTIYFTLEMVIEVSATLVATTHNRVPAGGGSNT